MDGFAIPIACASLLISIIAATYTWLSHQAAHVPSIETWFRPSPQQHSLEPDLRVGRATDLAIHLHNPKPEIRLHDLTMELSVYPTSGLPFRRRRLVIGRHKERVISDEHYDWALYRPEIVSPGVRQHLSLEHFLSTQGTGILEPIDKGEIKAAAYNLLIDRPIIIQCKTAYRPAVYAARRRRSIVRYKLKPFWTTDQRYPGQRLLLYWKDEWGNLYPRTI